MGTTDELRERLTGDRLRLQAELAELVGADEASGDREGRSYARHHVADDATETFDQEQAETLARHVRGVLDQVNRALHKLDVGSYGRCDECGRDIEVDRLAALPQATLCFNCRTRLEGRR